MPRAARTLEPRTSSLDPGRAGQARTPGCQQVTSLLTRAAPALPHRPHTASVVQEYLAAPMLCDGLKFDLRLYVVVRSLQPLQVWWWGYPGLGQP